MRVSARSRRHRTGVVAIRLFVHENNPAALRMIFM